MIQKLHTSGRWESSLFLAFMSLFCLLLVGLRVYATGQLHFIFLTWNLFLAFVPWAITTLLVLYPNTNHKKWLLASSALMWLLFFPNSPYIFTDLLHLRAMHTAPHWYDLIMILSFAWSGLMFGFQSLRDLERLVSQWIGPRVIHALVVFVLFLSSFGVYLGRYLRWNSWDVVQQPTALMADIADRVLHPLSHPATWGMTLLMGSLLTLMYWSLKMLQRSGTDPQASK